METALGTATLTARNRGFAAGADGCARLVRIGCGGRGKIVVRNQIDAVVISTPDHGHGPLTIDAGRMGKDVIVEKPHAHTSCSIVHLGNLANRVADQKLRYDWEKEQFIGSPEADKPLKRHYREKYAVREGV